MIARSSAVIEPGGRVTRLASQPPLTLRQLRTEAVDVATLCLVGAAAGPLAEDELHLDLTVNHGARACLTATGAALAQGREAGGRPGRLRTHAILGAGASLVATPPPLVACAGSSTEVTVRIELADTSSVVWRELLVLGRSQESAGAIRIDWDVRRRGVPLLRQSLDLTDPATSGWPGLLGGHRVIATELIAASPSALGALVPMTVVHNAGAVAQQLDDSSVLLTVLADDADSASAELSRLRRQVMPANSPPSPAKKA